MEVPFGADVPEEFDVCAVLGVNYEIRIRSTVCRVVYLLSNRQRKELFIRGSEIQIAIPAPIFEVDLVEYVEEVFAADVRPTIRSAVEDVVIVRPTSQRSGETLTEVLGAIQPDKVAEEHAERGDLLVTIEVIVVTLCQLETPRNRARSIQ
ncbi:unnamed protein product, partial [Durusdinium trenchii]